MIRGPVAALARVLPHSRTTTHPTFVREAARLDAVVVKAADIHGLVGVSEALYILFGWVPAMSTEVIE